MTPLEKYYLHNFLRNLVSTGGFFTMTYFFLNGFSISAIMITILIYAITALLITKPIGYLIGKWGIKKTFILHLIPTIASFFIVINISEGNYFLFFFWQFVHAFTVMLWRIPLNAYFSHNGDNNERGKEIVKGNILNILSGLIIPIFFGALVDKTGLVIFLGIKTLVHVIAGFVLGFKKDKKVKVDFNFKNFRKKVSSKVSKTFFFKTLPYAFSHNFLTIWIVINLGSFTLAGIFAAMKITTSILFNLFVGKLIDKNKIRNYFILSIFVSSLFFVVIPFVENALQIFILQFIFGLSTIILETVMNKEYHNEAKNSRDEVSYSIWREICIQGGLVVGGSVSLVLLQFVKEWQFLLPLGIISVLSLLYLLPKKIENS